MNIYYNTMFIIRKLGHRVEVQIVYSTSSACSWT